MQKEALLTKSLLYQDVSLLNPSLFVYDIPALVKKMKKKRSWAKGKLNVMILLKTPDKQIVLTTLHEETEIESFQSNDSITFQVIEGKLTFNSRKKSVMLDKGQLLTIHENIKYSLITDEETVLLMTISGNSLQLSVN